MLALLQIDPQAEHNTSPVVCGESLGELLGGVCGVGVPGGLPGGLLPNFVYVMYFYFVYMMCFIYLMDSLETVTIQR